MRSVPLRTAALSVSVVCASAPAMARDTRVSYQFDKTAIYEQTSGAAPTQAAAYRAYLNVGYSTGLPVPPVKWNRAWVEFDAPTSRIELEPEPIYRLVWRHNSGEYLTKSAFDAAYPNTVYTYRIDEGTLGPQFGLLTAPTDLYPLQIPHLSAASFDAIMHAVPGSVVPIVLSAFTADPSAQPRSWRRIRDLDTGQYPLAALQATSLNTAMLTPGHRYELEWFQGSWVRALNSGFGDGYSDLHYENGLRMQFTLAPAPGAIALAGIVSAVASWRRR